MDPTIPTPTASSTVTSPSSVSLQALPFHLLEISLISAQDLAPVSKSMRTYAVAWVQPNRKLTTRTDQQGHTYPMWNDKFVFRVDDEFLASDSSAITIEIYTLSWFRDILVGTVRVLMNNLIMPSLRSQSQPGTRFVALQVRRPSGTPQGILTMGVSFVDRTKRSMPLYNEKSNSTILYRDLADKKSHTRGKENEIDCQQDQINAKIQLWRSLSMGTEVTNEDFPLKPGSVCNGSAINGSELCSDVGPSASVVAAEIAKGLHAPATKGLRATAEVDETGSSIVEELTREEATAKGLTTSIERWKKERPPKHQSDEKSLQESVHSRRNSDGGGLFSCFGNAYGFEFTIVCGASNNDGKMSKSGSRNKKKRSGDHNSI
ncbi:hypothetical protein RJ639_000045 [Escallonia herrerae]|uniref:C2 domain-containing protein n=1 Tax=Escallonia herrerae TaxID=1293975 RepID=A0AA89BTE5_9ASTE|nr:hypothetical protein RJ639_025581 [Escallonia herrerae]KAK3043156.1 hypothetical protein RJ639_000045 [Escallonia herrerae]